MARSACPTDIWGQQLAASTYNLHFGNYGGLPVKLAYVVFGLALTVVVATGTSIWLSKRQRRGLREPRLRAGWDGVIWGVPVALALTFLARLLIGNEAPLIAIFWVLTIGIPMLAVAIRPEPRPKRLLQRLLVASATAGLAVVVGRIVL